jgi:hypothetical protein
VYAQKTKNNDKVIYLLMQKHLNLKTYSETGSYIGTSKVNDDPPQISDVGKHTFFLDNVNKKVRIDADLKYYKPNFSDKHHYICTYEDSVDNIFSNLPKDRDSLSKKQEEILTTINRHTSAFHLKNSHFNLFQKNIFEDTIAIQVETEKLNSTKCYKLSRKYLRPVAQKRIEWEKKEKQRWDSMGVAHYYDELPKRLQDFEEIQETYWFRKSDGMLIKNIHRTKTMMSQDIISVYLIEHLYDPKSNPILPPDVFKRNK